MLLQSRAILEDLGQALVFSRPNLQSEAQSSPVHLRFWENLTLLETYHPGLPTARDAVDYKQKSGRTLSTTVPQSSNSFINWPCRTYLKPLLRMLGR